MSGRIRLVVLCAVLSLPLGSSSRAAKDAGNSEYGLRLAKQELQMDEISRRLGGIETSIKDVQGDVKQLMATDQVMRFIITVTKLLVPGVLIAAFGIWFTRYLNGRKPKENKACG